MASGYRVKARDDSRWWDKIAKFRGIPRKCEIRWGMVERVEGGALVYSANWMTGDLHLDTLTRQKALVQKAPLPIIGDVSMASDDELMKIVALRPKDEPVFVRNVTMIEPQTLEVNLGGAM